MRVPLPGISNAVKCALLVAVIGAAVAIAGGTGVAAQEQSSLKVWACGGLGEEPCVLGTMGYFENGGHSCDHGLVHSPAGTCEDSDKRRRQGVGQSFRPSWMANTLRHQSRNLNWTNPIDMTAGQITVHNAFENAADGYSPITSTQKYSITEQLDAGFRVLEFDVWSTVLDHLKLGHGGASFLDRPPHNAIKEIATWLLEPGHLDETVIIEIEDHINDATQLPYLLDPIKVYFKDSGIGVWGNAEMTPRYHSADGYNQWPSQAEMLAAGKRVLILFRDTPYTALADDYLGGTGYSSFGLPEDGSTPAKCFVRGRYSDDLADPFTALWGEFSDVWAVAAHLPTAAQLAWEARCAVDFVKVNRLLVDNERLLGAAWSWAELEPRPRAAQMAAVLTRSQGGRWTSQDRHSGNRPYLCGYEKRTVNYLQVRLTIATDAAGNTVTGPWENGYAACANTPTSLDARWKFWAPRNKPENEKSQEYADANGTDLWLNFANADAADLESWVVNHPPAIVGVDAGASTVSRGSAVNFTARGITDPDLGVLLDEALTVTWDFDDGTQETTTNVSYAPSHVFAAAGDYDVTVRVTDRIGLAATVTKRITVTPGTPPAIFFVGDEWLKPGGVGTYLVQGYASEHDNVSLISLNCGAGWLVSQQPDAIPNENLSVDFACGFPEGQTQMIVTAVVGDRDGTTTKSLTVRNGQVPTAVMSGPTRSSVGRIEVFAVNVIDTTGIVTALAASCGDAGSPLVPVDIHGNPVPGGSAVSGDGYPFIFGCQFTAASAASLVSLTFKDETGLTGIAKTLVKVGSEPTGVIEGPTTSSEVTTGTAAVFNLRGASTDGDDVSLVSIDCHGGETKVPLGDRDVTAGLFIKFSCTYLMGPSAKTITAVISDVDGQHTITRDVTVRDVTPPDVFINNQPGPVTLTREATSSSGAMVSFRADAVDNFDNDLPAVCSVPSGSWFPIGTTTVTCFATDTRLNKGEATLIVIVADTTKPVLMASNVTAVGDDPQVAGAVVTFDLDATDNIQVASTTCTSASGSVFPFGTTTVTCTASDVAGNLSAPAVFTVTVSDGIKPVVTVPADIIVNATSAGGATVTFTASASDNLDGSLPVSCLPASGVFAAGRHQVTCTAVDAAGNPGTNSFWVEVLADTTNPELTVSDVTVVGSNPAVAGAMVTFAPVAADNIGVTSLTCSRASGTLFPFGSTTVSCTAADAAGNSTTKSFMVMVRDGVAPVVQVPANLTLPATSESGAVASFTTAASDNVSGSLVPSCSTASGAMFAVGLTSVTCTAQDAAGNTGAASFTVTVTDVTTPGEMAGSGFVRTPASKSSFEFRVVEKSRHDVERGRFRLEVDYTARNRKSDRFVATDVTFVAFSDDPAIRPGRSRKAQIDTVRFSGAGEWNGKRGYRFDVLAADGGEPGRHRESVTIMVTSPSGAVVAQVDGELSGGNVQSRRIHR